MYQIITNTELDYQIDKTKYFEPFEREMDYLSKFLDDFSFLIFSNGRIISALIAGRNCILYTSLIDSAHRTVRSIKASCSIGAFSDANTLVRKLRDDLLQYTYVLSIINEFNRNVSLDDLYITPTNKENIDYELIDRLKSKLSKDKLAVRAWTNNTIDKQKWAIRKKLDYSNYMNVLKNNHFVSQVLNQYNLVDYWDVLSKRLNNYVHGNGPSYALHNRVMKHDVNLEAHLKNIEYRTSYVVSFFMVLLLMIDSSLISSSDYIDHLDSNAEPPEGCQYWVAPFVQGFIDKKVSTLHPELKDYLKENNVNGMEIV